MELIGFTQDFTFYFNDIFSQLSLIIIYLFVEFSRFWSFLLNWEQIWFAKEMELSVSLYLPILFIYSWGSILLLYRL